MFCLYPFVLSLKSAINGGKSNLIFAISLTMPFDFTEQLLDLFHDNYMFGNTSNLVVNLGQPLFPIMIYADTMGTDRHERYGVEPILFPIVGVSNHPGQQ